MTMAYFTARLSLTVVIPRLPNLRLDLAEVHADYEDDSPTYDFGPGIRNSTSMLSLICYNLQLMTITSALNLVLSY